MIIKENIWDLLDVYYKSYPSDMKGKANHKDIKAAENNLRLKFNSSYINYVIHYGGGFIEAYPIYGLIEHSQMGESLNNVVSVTKFYKETQNWPGIEEWYIVSDDGYGNPIGIDKQGKVWLSDHDAGFEKVKLADSFDEFLYKVLTDTLYE